MEAEEKKGKKRPISNVDLQSETKIQMSLESVLFCSCSMARACEKVNETMSVDFQSNGQSILSTPSYFGHSEEGKKRTENSFNRHICNKQQHLDGLEGEGI